MPNSSEISRQVDQTYKNLLEGFNPAARQIITAGKAYLKALHGAATSSKLYLDAISKLCSQVQQNPTGESSDIGSCLEQVVEVYKEIQSRQNNILKVFYVDFIVPLETNLEKDGKVLQTNYKKFLSNQKARQDAVTRAESNVRKQRKKKLGSKTSIDKEIKTFQALDEEQTTLDAFLDQSYHEVTTQERRRYSFVLERLCSLGRHHLALHSKGVSLLQKQLDGSAFISNGGEANPKNQLSVIRSDVEGIYSTPGEDTEVEAGSVTPPLRRAHSLDDLLSDAERRSPEPPLRTKGFHPRQEFPSERPLSRAKSEYDLDQRQDFAVSHQSRRSMMIPERRNLARASFPFQGTADNQLSFEEGDVITLIGEKNKGWQYGENQRTRQIGWFPVAYTEQLEEVDSAIGCSYNDTPPSSQFKTYHDFPTRGRSLDQLDRRPKKNKKIRARSSSTSPSPNTDRPLLLRSSPTNLHQILSEEEKGRTYYSIRPPSSCDSDNKKTFETFNSHLFLSEGTEEDLESYEGSHRGSYSPHRQKQDKHASFIPDHSLSPSLCRSLTSPELPSCFRKSISSKDSVHCSDDSGFSNEENMHPSQRKSTFSYDESYSKSLNSSWLTDSYEVCDNRNSPENCYHSYPREEKGSPTFLRYLYPSYKDSVSPTPVRHSSVDGLDDICNKCSKKESWIVNAFGTLSRKKKKTLVSPCAQKIASQKERKRNERSSLHRSSSLLCLDVTKCTSSPEEAYTSNYEDINYATWHHVPVVDVPSSLPSPPPYDPPPLPKKPVTSPNKPSSHFHHSYHVKNTPKSRNHAAARAPESSSGNSSWSENDESCVEAYIMVNNQSRDVSTDGQSSQYDKKRYLTRSYTWASPDAKKCSVPSLAAKQKKNTYCNTSSMESTRTKSPNSFNYPIAPPPKPTKSKINCYKTFSTPQSDSNKWSPETDDAAPPLPPRKKKPSPTGKKVKSKEVNIFNYSKYMCQRLTNLDGTCRFDQRSFTTGQQCSIWYDLWGNDPSVGKLV